MTIRVRFGVLFALALTVGACGNPPANVAGDETSPAPARALSASQIVDVLKAKGLPIAEIVTFSAETDENQLLGRPGQYSSKTNFKDSRAGADQSESSLEVFTNAKDAERRRDYVATVTESMPMVLQYQYLEGKTLLRLDKALTPTQAAEYEKALKEVASQ